MRNKDLERLRREEKKKHRVDTLIHWLAWAVILAGLVYGEMRSGGELVKVVRLPAHETDQPHPRLAGS
jgi:hypothetical protein